MEAVQKVNITFAIFFKTSVITLFPSMVNLFVFLYHRAIQNKNREEQSFWTAFSNLSFKTYRPVWLQCFGLACCTRLFRCNSRRANWQR